jgi:hypothetical protein
LAARYADVWNAGPCLAEACAAASTRLDELLVARDRAPQAVRRSILGAAWAGAGSLVAASASC